MNIFRLSLLEARRIRGFVEVNLGLENNFSVSEWVY